MLNLNQNIFDFYIEYIDTELYKSKLSSSKARSTSKIVFINKLERISYWFPPKIGVTEQDKNSKLLSKKFRQLPTAYNFGEFSFLDSLGLFISNNFNINLEEFLNSAEFTNSLILLNESVRRKGLRRQLPYVETAIFHKWSRPQLINDQSYLKYYYDYSPHRTIARIRKFNFIKIGNWFNLTDKNWAFRRKSIRFAKAKSSKYERFETRVIRIPDAVFSIWAEQQLRFAFFNFNSFDFTSDIYSSKFFSPLYPAPTKQDLLISTSPLSKSLLFLSLVYWIMSFSTKMAERNPSLAYFSNSYNFNQYSYISRHKYLKNYFSSYTPKYANVYFRKLRKAHQSWNILNNYISVFKPSYWNLKKGLDLHPHENWTWEGMCWWEDPIPFLFSRFNTIKRKTRFIGQSHIKSSDFNWFYRSWFHEDMYMELSSSYYRTYYNADYLTPKWRIPTSYSEKRKGHFDPRWHERLFEYVVYPYMELFHPSTKRYYIDYFNHPNYIDPKSFLMLNFSWKFNKDPLFISKTNKISGRSFRSIDEFRQPVFSVRPNFKSVNNRLDPYIFFPLIFDVKDLILDDFIHYQKSMLFLLNLFSKSPNLVVINLYYINFLFAYLNQFSILKCGSKDFIKFVGLDQSLSYVELARLLREVLELADSDLLFYRERVFAEYLAFKRFYSLLISEYGNS